MASPILQAEDETIASKRFNSQCRNIQEPDIMMVGSCNHVNTAEE